MKLRWSNNKDTAFTFDANDLASFVEQGASALRSLAIMTEKRVHRGEIRKTFSWCDIAHLQLYRDNWYNPGRINKTDNINYFEPADIRSPWMEADDLDGLFVKLDSWFLSIAEETWLAIVDTWNWLDALDFQVMLLGDEIGRKQ